MGEFLKITNYFRTIVVVDNIGHVSFDDLEKWDCILSVRVVGENARVQNAPWFDLRHDAAVDAQSPPLETSQIFGLALFFLELQLIIPFADELNHAITSYCHTAVNPASWR